MPCSQRSPTLLPAPAFAPAARPLPQRIHRRSRNAAGRAVPLLLIWSIPFASASCENSAPRALLIAPGWRSCPTATLPVSHLVCLRASSCQRHGFTALAVDTLAAITFNFGAFVLAGALTAITVVGINADPASKLENDYKYPLLVTFGVVSWAVAWALLHFIVSILLNIIDAACT